jgi:predicted GIY-YIG superfamily endonuclease
MEWPRCELRLGKPVMQINALDPKQRSFCYVYILQSAPQPKHYYVGLTDDLHERLRRHNSGKVYHTAKLRPWIVKTAIAFRNRERAARFELYLKSASGRAFAKKHL